MKTVLEAAPVSRLPLEPPLPLVEARALRKAFDGVEVLRGVDLAIGEGELLAIVGRSGCGKSTLLRLLAGLETADSGSVKVRGEPLRGLNTASRLMFQEASLLPWRTVLQNVKLAAPGRDEAVAFEVLEEVGLAHRAGEWPSILSGGQRQRVALARALASRSPLLFFDEPLGALDALTRLEMQQLIERLWQLHGFGALLITHDVEEAVALGDRVLVMEAGRFVECVEIDLPRPRDRSSPALLRYRERLLKRVLRDG